MAFNLLGALIILAISTGLNLLLRPRIKRPKGQAIEFPQADEGVPIPIGFGTFAVAPNIVWWGNTLLHEFEEGTTGYHADMVGTLCLGPMDTLVDIIVGGKSVRFEPVTLRQRGGLGAEQVIVPSLPYARPGSANTPATFVVKADDMFGQEEREGGLKGTIRFYWGGLGQAADPVTTAYMQEAGLSSGTGRPGVCYVVFTGITGPPYSDGGSRPFYWGTVPTPKDITFILRHNPQTLGVGYPQQDANAAEIMYDLQHSSLRGLGLTTTLTDTDSYTDVAATLVNEQLGISCCFSTQDEVEDMIEDVLKHIMGVLRVDPLTGQYNLKLARADYALTQIPRVSTSLRGAGYANARDLTLSRPNYRETSNDIQLTYRRFETGPSGGVTGQVLTNNLQYGIFGYRNFDTGAKGITAVTIYDDGVPITAGFNFDATGWVTVSELSGAAEGSVITIDYTAGPVFSGYKEATARWQDLGSIQQSGEIRSLTLDYPFFTSDLTAGMHVAKLGQQLSRSLWSARWVMDRHGWSLAAGDVVRLDHAPEDANGNEIELIEDEPFRITEIDYGTLEDGAITVSAIEDVFGQDVLPILPPPPTTQVPTLVAPDIAIGYSATSAIRVCLYPTDQNFQIKLWRATSNLGLGITAGASVVAVLPGTTTHYDDTQPVAARGETFTTGRPLAERRWTPSTRYGGTQQYTPQMSGGRTGLASRVVMPAGSSVALGAVYYYAAQLVPTSSQIGYVAGDLTPWQSMTATAGTPGACTCTIPTVSYATSDDGVTATVTLTITDAQGRVSLVEFQTQAGTAPESAWTTDTSPYSASVARVEDQNSRISWRITYLNCSGASAVDLTGSVTFPISVTNPDNYVIGNGDFVFAGSEPVTASS